jgi:hypothetical protein
MKNKYKMLIAASVLALATFACAFPGDGATPQPQVVTVVVTAEQPTPAPSPTPQPTDTTAPGLPSATPAPSATSAPQCVVQKRLNFRSGPGTAYDPPLRALETGVVLRPVGYNPIGVPGGDWVQGIDPQNIQAGWVSAGAEFIQCNIDLTTLPSVAVQPPPTPSAPRVSNKPPEGPTGGDIQYEIVMDPNYLMQIRARIDGTANNGDGIDTVKFIIERNGQEVYTESEANPAFCIFKGGEPNCNPWPKTNGRYTWGEGGPVVETGDYQATTRITRDADNSYYDQWTFTFTVDLP